MEKQKKKGGLNKNSENGKNYKVGYYFTFLESSYLGELKRNEEKEKEKEREKRRKKDREKRNCN